jgi:hypothetical protein
MFKPDDEGRRGGRKGGKGGKGGPKPPPGGSCSAPQKLDTFGGHYTPLLIELNGQFLR